ILKMIATGETEGVEPARFAAAPVSGRAGEGAAIERFTSWDSVRERYVEIAGRLHRKVTDVELAEIEAAFAALGQAVSNILESHIKFQNIGANESQNERHKQNSNPNRSLDSEPRFQESRGEAGHNTKPAGQGRGEGAKPGTEPDASTTAEIGIEADSKSEDTPPLPDADRAGEAEAPPAARPDGAKPARAASDGAFPLGMVMQACPDLASYAPDGVRNWRDFLDTAAKVRPMLGISPSAWEEAESVMGEVRAAITVAAILQRAETISSPGGYLRSLTAKAETGAFSLGPMLMALLAANKPNLRRSA
ncbi:Replication protein C C-terminal region, partial [Pseudoxanthobacter soli DSM 19599]